MCKQINGVVFLVDFVWIFSVIEESMATLRARTAQTNTRLPNNCS